MLSGIARTIREHGLLATGDRVLVAVSGGPDSTALFHALRALAPRLGITIEVATVDHGLRPEAAGEAAAVAAACHALGVHCEILRVDVRGARGPHVSWQDAARRVRLSALEALAGRRGVVAIALGHTADDQAETVLFRIVRGTGLSGLAGIPYRRGIFVRPLLDTRRAEVLRYLTKRRVPFVEDPSNDDRRFTRSRIRHEWLALLRRENPRVVESLLRLATEARARSPGHLPTLPGDLPRLPRRAAMTVARLVAEGAGTRRVATRGGEVEVSYGRSRWLPRDAVPVPMVAADRVRIAGPGTYRLNPGGPMLDVQLTSLPPPRDAVAFDAGALPFPLFLRRREPGDRLRLRGGRGSKKVTDLLTNAKIPRPRRALLPVLAAGDGTVLYVPGLRPSDIARPDNRTRSWIAVRLVVDFH